MRHLQEIQDQYAAKGLVVLGMDTSEAKDIAVEELHRQGVTFPNVIDSSPTASKIQYEAYRNHSAGTPLNYVVDREGKIVDGWCGNDETFSRAMEAIRKAGIQDACWPVPGTATQTTSKPSK